MPIRADARHPDGHRVRRLPAGAVRGLAARAGAGRFPRAGRRPSDPVLLLSGEFDPVTPPRYGEAVARTLPNARHLVLRGQGHGVLGVGCTPRLLAEFLERADAGASRRALPRRARLRAAVRAARTAGIRERHAAACRDPRRGPAQGISHARRPRAAPSTASTFEAADGQITGLLGPERRRQDDDAAHALHADGARRGPRARRRCRPGGRPGARARRARRAARRARHLQAADRAREHRVLRRAARARRAHDRRSAPSGSARRSTCTTSSTAAPKGFRRAQRTKTAIARALVHDPRNVVLDEPTNGLDVMTTRALRDFLLGAARRGPLRAALEPHHAGGRAAL